MRTSEAHARLGPRQTIYGEKDVKWDLITVTILFIHSSVLLSLRTTHGSLSALIGAYSLLISPNDLTPPIPDHAASYAAASYAFGSYRSSETP